MRVRRVTGIGLVPWPRALVTGLCLFVALVHDEQVVSRHNGFGPLVCASGVVTDKGILEGAKPAVVGIEDKGSG